MARAGLCSRRDAEKWIEQGRVSVNGKKISSPALNVSEEDSIFVDGKPLGKKTNTKLWLYYKPRGLVTTHKDEQGRATVFSVLPPEIGRVISIGRLDKESEGLLLLTNDGELARKAELPSTGWLRRYRVWLKGVPTAQNLETIRKGVTVEGIHYAPMLIRIERMQEETCRLMVSIQEGKNREIRRIFADFDCRVERLKRLSYGPFRLGELKPGMLKEVPAGAVETVTKQA